MTAGSFATTYGQTYQPKDEKNYGHDPQHVQRKAEAEEERHQQESQKNHH